FSAGGSGSAAVSGTISGIGAMVVAGGDVALTSGTALKVATLSLSGGTQTLVETGGAISLGGNTLTLSGPVDFGSGGVAGSGSVVGGGKLVTDFTTSLDGLTVSGATWSNAGTITESGSGTLTLGGSASLVNVLGGVFDITGSGGIALTSAGGGSEHNFGTFEKTAGGAR